MSAPTKAECFDRFWDVIALAHENLMRRKAAEAASKSK